MTSEVSVHGYLPPKQSDHHGKVLEGKVAPIIAVGRQKIGEQTTQSPQVMTLCYTRDYALLIS